MDPNSEDLNFVETWKTIEPDIEKSPEGEVFVKIASIPPEIIKTIETSALSAKYVQVNGQSCLSLVDWKECREKLGTEIATRMRHRSLEIAILGPQLGDLEHAPLLSDWVATRDVEFGGAILVGMPTNHPTLQSELIHTSRICGFDPNKTWARTASRWYRLGAPATSEYLVGQAGLIMLGLEGIALDFQEIQALIAQDLVDLGLRDV